MVRDPPSLPPRAALRVALFGSGSPLFAAVAETLARETMLVGVVLPPKPLRYGWRRLLSGRRGPVARGAMPAGITIFEWSTAVESRLRNLRPDLLVIASFPKILPPAALAVSTSGTLNVHMSPLPRHRGPDPVFWTYFHDDALAGVTVHWATESVDAGDIVAQETVPVTRGRASRDLYHDLARRAAGLISRSLQTLVSGSASCTPQDERAATYESLGERTRAVVPYAEWPAERVWHVLSGLGDQHNRLLRDADGKPAIHGRATGLSLEGSRGPGLFETGSDSYRVHCSDGVVTVARCDQRR